MDMNKKETNETEKVTGARQTSPVGGSGGEGRSASVPSLGELPTGPRENTCGGGGGREPVTIL